MGSKRGKGTARGGSRLDGSEWPRERIASSGTDRNYRTGTTRGNRAALLSSARITTRTATGDPNSCRLAHFFPVFEGQIGQARTSAIETAAAGRRQCSRSAEAASKPTPEDGLPGAQSLKDPERASFPGALHTCPRFVLFFFRRPVTTSAKVAKG